MSGGRESGKSMLVALHDDEDDICIFTLTYGFGMKSGNIENQMTCFAIENQIDMFC